MRYSRGDNRNGFTLTGMGYWADWDSTDQVPDRAIASGLIDRFGFIDPTDRGTTDRQSVAAEFQHSVGSSSIRATGFLLHNSLDLFSNFTYFLEDPVAWPRISICRCRVRDLRTTIRPAITSRARSIA